MNTASLELCQELYKLSGWEPQDCAVYALSGGGKIFQFVRNPEPNLIGMDYYIPAYDLGHLLRKLPPQTCIKKEFDASPETPAHYRALYDTVDGRYFWLGGDTPEDATARLAIHLFKHGVLKREK